MLLVAPPALPVLAVAPVNQDKQGIALEGYDPVAYFTEGRPVPGSAEITHRWNGATWRFATREHRDLFAAEPERYTTPRSTANTAPRRSARITPPPSIPWPGRSSTASCT
jgi:YHS domain-containing protein